MDSGEAVWNSAAWLEEATAWIDASLPDRVGEPQRWRVTRWSVLLTVDTAAGRVWMKASRPECAFEVDLYGMLAGLPGVVEPLAVDAERGWMLLPDAGTPLGEGGLEAAEAALVGYAAMQRRLGARVEEMLAPGGTDLRPARLGAVLEEVCAVAVADLAAGGDPEGLVGHVHAARARLDEVEAWGAALGSAAVGPSVDHGDLHLSNVLVGPGGPVLIDWGDAVVGHPFASLRVLLGAVGGARLGRLRDAYLEQFSDLASLGELRELAAVAVRVAPIHRAVAIQRAVRSLPGEPPADARWAAFVARELADLG